MSDRPSPSNGDVGRCQWYLSTEHTSTHVTVHLWGEGTWAVDSSDGLDWKVRRCVVCGALDDDYLHEQYKAREAYE